MKISDPDLDIHPPLNFFLSGYQRVYSAKLPPLACQHKQNSQLSLQKRKSFQIRSRISGQTAASDITHIWDSAGKIDFKYLLAWFRDSLWSDETCNSAILWIASANLKYYRLVKSLGGGTKSNKNICWGKCIFAMANLQIQKPQMLNDFPPMSDHALTSPIKLAISL